MQIDVTSYFNDVEHGQVSGSRAELGQDAGKITWTFALAETEAMPFLKTDADLAYARKHFKGYGAWSEEEIAAWSAHELNAMVAQEISNDIREGGLEVGTDQAWIDYENATTTGEVSGNLFRDDRGNVFYYFGD